MKKKHRVQAMQSSLKDNINLYQNIPPLIEVKTHKNNEKIKWKKIKNLDIENIIENNDVITLEKFLPNLMNCKLTKEEFKNTDKKSLAKLLQIYQLSLEYFSYTHNYLSNLNEKLDEETQENEKFVN